MERRTLAALGGAAAVAVSAGCGGGTPGPGSSPAATTSTQAQGLDLHKVNWRSAVVPGKACFASGSVRLHDGVALIPNRKLGQPSRPGSQTQPYVRLSLSYLYNKRLLVYGNLERGGTSDAAVGLTCDNNGGTAGGALLYSFAVYSGKHGRAQLLGLLTPQVHPHGHPLLFGPRIEPDRVILGEAFYGPHDGTCCPSGRARTVWTFAAGKFRAQTTVTRRASEQL